MKEKRYEGPREGGLQDALGDECVCKGVRKCGVCLTRTPGGRFGEGGIQDGKTEEEQNAAVFRQLAGDSWAEPSVSVHSTVLQACNFCRCGEEHEGLETVGAENFRRCSFASAKPLKLFFFSCLKCGDLHPQIREGGAQVFQCPLQKDAPRFQDGLETEGRSKIVVCRETLLRAVAEALRLKGGESVDQSAGRHENGILQSLARVIGFEEAELEGKEDSSLGVFLFRDFVQLREEDGLLAKLDELSLQPSQSGRLKADFGAQVNFKKRKIKTHLFDGLPSFAAPLVRRVFLHRKAHAAQRLPETELRMNSAPGRTEGPAEKAVSVEEDFFLSAEGACCGEDSSAQRFADLRLWGCGDCAPCPQSSSQDEADIIRRSSQLICPFAKEAFLPVELCVLQYRRARAAHIAPHLDDSWLWGERLVTLSLGADSVLSLLSPVLCIRVADSALAEEALHTLSPEEALNLRRRSRLSVQLEVRLPMPRRSLTVLAGAARKTWLHAIWAHHVYGVRTALTLRELSPEFLPGRSRPPATRSCAWLCVELQREKT